MVYKKFKDYKLEIIKLIFTNTDPSSILCRIEELELKGSITVSQIQLLSDIVYNANVYKMLRPANMKQALAYKLRYDEMILEYKGRIIARYYPSKGMAVLG